MLYLFTFILCLMTDYNIKQKKEVRFIILLWLYIFLCFGYMTGSDWRNYELMYNYEDLERYLLKGEIGFVYLVKCFKKITCDFWVFNACMKLFYLYSLLDIEIK